MTSEFRYVSIVEVDYGLSSVYSDGTIEINRKLEGPLRDKIMKHELAHDPGRYSLVDFRTDYQSKNPYFFESLKFCMKNPEAWINFMPVMYSYYLEQWSFNWSALFPFVLWASIFTLITHFLFHVPFLHAALAWFNVMILMNAILLYYTHRYVLEVRKIRTKINI